MHRRHRSSFAGVADAEGRGKWNTYDVTVKGTRLIVTLNGVALPTSRTAN